MHLTMLVSFKPFMCVPATLYSPIVCMKWLCCQNGVLFTPYLGSFWRVEPNFKWRFPVVDVLMLYACSFLRKSLCTSQCRWLNLNYNPCKIKFLSSSSSCVLHTFLSVSLLFCTKWNRCWMKTKTIVPSNYCTLVSIVNFKIRVLQWSAVQLRVKCLGKGGGKR